VEKQQTKLTKLYWPVATTKALTKATDYTIGAKTVEGHHQIGAPNFRAGPMPPLSNSFRRDCV